MYEVWLKVVEESKKNGGYGEILREKKGKVGIFPSPRAYIQGQSTELTDMFPNMTSRGREA